SIWELIEHLRFTQSDILEFILRPDYVRKTWPDDYWPDKKLIPDGNMWQESVAGFRSDLEAIRGLVLAGDADFFTPIPHCKHEKYTLFRQILLVADHNAHHLGQVICLRRMLNIW
ncbi:MAG: DinB family protein, partial [Calditrichota bacterium]